MLHLLSKCICQLVEFLWFLIIYWEIFLKIFAVYKALYDLTVSKIIYLLKSPLWKFTKTYHLYFCSFISTFHFVQSDEQKMTSKLTIHSCMRIILLIFVYPPPSARPSYYFLKEMTILLQLLLNIITHYSFPSLFLV